MNKRGIYLLKSIINIEPSSCEDNMVRIEGVYGNLIIPFAFKASKKGNNPDVLSRVQMMKAQDKVEIPQS